MKVVSIIDDQRMSRLYELFVLGYYKRHYPQLHAAATRIEWNTDNAVADFLPIMRTDIMLRHGEKVLIIDTKYYETVYQENAYFNSKTWRSGHLYQIYAYVKNADTNHTGNIAGMLLYAENDRIPIPSKEYSIDGNKIYVNSLNLNQDFPLISAQLDSIAGLLLKDQLSTC